MAGHPIHLLLIPIPIAFWVAAFLIDRSIVLDYRDPFWARGSFWLTAEGLVGGGVAATLGLIDFPGIRRAWEGAQARLDSLYREQ